jgi:hypothetical protein
MKKLKVLMGALALIASMALVSCGQPTSNNGLVSGGAEETTWDGVVDLTTLAGYDATAGGIVKDFGAVKNSYDMVAALNVADLGYTADCGYSKVYVVADVYNGTTKYDLSSTWGARLMITVGDASKDANKNFNAGVANQTQAVGSVDDQLLIQIKAEPVTKVVVTKIAFTN